MNERSDEGWIEDLVDFDENLRLGRPMPPVDSTDPDLAQAREFLLKLQSIWPRTPKKIGGYTITRNLGQGALGTTYLVEDAATRQSYVLKIVWPDLCADSQTRSTLAQVAGTLQCLRHPQIASLLEIRETGPVSYVVSQYCPGPSLAHWRRKYPQPVPWPVAAATIARLAETLDIAHRHGVTHGNLKPANIFLPDDNEIDLDQLHHANLKVADFALAKAVQQAGLPTDGGLPWPMPQYLAPEQLRHRTRDVEPASDVYALGVLGYELLTGRCPVKGAIREEIVAHTRDSTPTLPRQFRPDLPRELETIVLNCLKKDPAERPASAKMLAEDMHAIVSASNVKPQGAWWKQWLGWK